MCFYQTTHSDFSKKMVYLILSTIVFAYCYRSKYEFLIYYMLRFHFMNLFLAYVFRIFRFFDYDKQHAVGVTGQQRIPTRSWYLIPPIIFVDVRVCSASVMYFSFPFLILKTVCYHHISVFLHKVISRMFQVLYRYRRYPLSLFTSAYLLQIIDLGFCCCIFRKFQMQILNKSLMQEISS